MRIGLRRIAAALLLSALSAGGLAATTTPIAAASSAEDNADDGYGRMMLLLDSSGSMAQPAGGGGGGESRIEAAKSALHTVIDALPADAEVGLRVFGATVFSRTDKDACTDSQAIVEPGTDNRSELSEAIDGYKPYGETPIPYALEQAAKDLGYDGPRSIVLVSDGESTCQPDPCEVAKKLRDSGIDLQIDVVGLSVTGKARSQLQCIAKNGNGNYYDANDAGDIESRLARVAQRAVRPFTLSGEPITGGPEDDPTPVTAGDWIDRIGGSQASRSYVFTRETPGTTLRVSAIVQREQISTDSLRIEILAADGTRCDSGLVTNNYDTRDIIGVEADAGDEDAQGLTDGCAAAGDLRITVTRDLPATSKRPFGLRVSEEPVVTDPGFATFEDTEVDVSAPQVAGKAQRVEGGSSFANATEIGQGRWSSTVVPGEALLYRFPLEFGQSAKISVTFPKPSAAIADRFGRFPPLSAIVLYDPMQGQLALPPGSHPSDSPVSTSLLTATRTVSRVQETPLQGTFNGGGTYTTAGDYYLGLSVQREDYTVEIPLMITVEIIGDSSDGPTYADGASWTVADGLTAESASEDPTTSASAIPSGDADSTPQESSSTDEGSRAMLVAGAVGVAGIAAVIAVFVLWRRRRT